MRVAWLLAFVLLGSLSGVTAKKGTVHSCVSAVASVEENGYGDSIESCMSCEPTFETCYPGCQKMINKLYRSCDRVCLPDGYYFDPKKELAGCWGDHKEKMKIAVERCGCNSAFSIASVPTLIIAFGLVFVTALLAR